MSALAIIAAVGLSSALTLSAWVVVTAARIGTRALIPAKTKCRTSDHPTCGTLCRLRG